MKSFFTLIIIFTTMQASALSYNEIGTYSTMREPKGEIEAEYIHTSLKNRTLRTIEGVYALSDLSEIAIYLIYTNEESETKLTDLKMHYLSNFYESGERGLDAAYLIELGRSADGEETELEAKLIFEKSIGKWTANVTPGIELEREHNETERVALVDLSLSRYFEKTKIAFVLSNEFTDETKSLASAKASYSFNRNFGGGILVGRGLNAQTEESVAQVNLEMEF